MSILRTIFLLALVVPVLAAQQTQAPAASPRDGGASTVNTHDGGATQVLQSIYIPMLQNAPFTATLHTEWVRSLPDGGTFTVVNDRRIARDKQGRLYEERWLLAPKNGNIPSRMNLIQIADPNTHTHYNCFLLEEPHRCILETLSETVSVGYRPAVGKNGPLPNNAGYSIHEDLGAQTLLGIDTVGTRDSLNYNEGYFGNDRPFTVKREFWYAASLGINLYSEVTDPSFGKQIFTVTDVSLSDPDLVLFELPQGFKVEDRRKTRAPQE